MRIEVLYFGMLKDAVGVRAETMEMEDGAVAGEVVERVRSRDGGDAAWEGIAVAVNREYAGRGTVLRDGDEVALLPPVSGGGA